MSVSRRRFLKSGAVVSAALVLKPGTFSSGPTTPCGPTAPRTTPVQSYSREMFEPYIGETFQVRVGKQMVDLKLVALDESPQSAASHRKTPAQTAFPCDFRRRSALPTTAKIHNLNHGELGSFDLFMGQSKAGSKFLHTAIVNHLV